MIQVNDANGRFIGFTMVKPADKCKACGQSFSAHGGLAWVNADNGEHKLCNLGLDSPVAM
jgi:hypothetical protein